MNQTDKQSTWPETLELLRKSQINQSREGWIEDLTYGLRNLEVSDDEETRIEDIIEYQPESIRDHLQWTLDTLGYTAAYILFLQWIIIEPLKGITLDELQPAMLEWRLEWNNMEPEDIHSESIVQESKETVDIYLLILKELLEPVDRGQASHIRWAIYQHLQKTDN